MLIQKLLAIAHLGASVVLYVLIALSVLSIGVILSRWWFFQRRKADIRRLDNEVLRRLQAGDRPEVIKWLRTQKSIEAGILAEALDWYEAGPEAFREILEKGLRERRKECESGMVFLGTLGNNAPFIGLFGTVLGIVTAFKELGSTTAGQAAAGNMNNVMSGIAEALVATAIGILVAIPAVVAFNIFQKKTNDIEENVGALGNAVVALMKKDEFRPARPKVAA